MAKRMGVIKHLPAVDPSASVIRGKIAPHRLRDSRPKDRGEDESVAATGCAYRAVRRSDYLGNGTRPYYTALLPGDVMLLAGSESESRRAGKLADKAGDPRTRHTCWFQLPRERLAKRAGEAVMEVQRQHRTKWSKLQGRDDRERG